MSRDARQFYKSGRPFLQQYMPFWLAAIVERLVIVLVPLFGLMVPLVRMAPSLYGWRIRRRILGIYIELAGARTASWTRRAAAGPAGADAPPRPAGKAGAGGQVAGRLRPDAVHAPGPHRPGAEAAGGGMTGRTDVLPPIRRGPVVALLIIATVIVGALLWSALDRFMPMPPTHIVMATGPAGGMYDELGKEYEALLLESGITVERRPSAGDVENRAGSATRPGGGRRIPAGGSHQRQGVARALLAGDGAVSATLDLLSGARANCGRVPEGPAPSGSPSGRRSAARARCSAVVLARSRIDADSVLLLRLPPAAAAEALIGRRIDAAVILDTWDAPAVQQLLAAPGISILPLKRVDAYVDLYPYLDKAILPEGIGDLGSGQPAG